jgi:inhibitor of cysteine peptidase
MQNAFVTEIAESILGENIMRNILISSAIAAVLVMTTACNPAKPVILGIADNGNQVKVKLGDPIVINLESNPSTGYTWETIDLDKTIFEQAGDPTFKSSDPGVVGSGGTLTLTFNTVKAGTATLKLVYQRPWETNVEPTSTFAVEVTVK